MDKRLKAEEKKIDSENKQINEEVSAIMKRHNLKTVVFMTKIPGEKMSAICSHIEGRRIDFLEILARLFNSDESKDFRDLIIKAMVIGRIIS